MHALLEPDLGGESELSLRPLAGREHVSHVTEAVSAHDLGWSHPCRELIDVAYADNPLGSPVRMEFGLSYETVPLAQGDRMSKSMLLYRSSARGERRRPAARMASRDPSMSPSMQTITSRRPSAYA